MITFKEFLLKYSSINKTFLEDFNEIINENYLDMSNEFIVNSNNLQTWLNISTRQEFHNTIKRSYKLNIDYIITKSNNKGKGKNNEKIYMLTPDCAKMISQSTKSKIGTEVRKYFIEIEKMLYKYKDIIISNLVKENDKKIKILFLFFYYF
jgi:phage anti-repressor protein